jgi:hypothetical protein
MGERKYDIKDEMSTLKSTMFHLFAHGKPIDYNQPSMVKDTKANLQKEDLVHGCGVARVIFEGSGRIRSALDIADSETPFYITQLARRFVCYLHHCYI